MKSLVLSKQDARELEKLGGLTIAKIMRPAPPYIEGADFAERRPGGVLVCPDLRPYGDPDGEPTVFLPPVNPGDAAYIREPWYRLRDPKDGEPSDRVILAADSTAKDDETAYKWASPVSMPETAARRFVRVLGVSPVYSQTGGHMGDQARTDHKGRGPGHRRGPPSILHRGRGERLRPLCLRRGYVLGGLRPHE